MHPLSVLKVVGALLVVLGMAEIAPMAGSLLYGDPDWPVFLSTGAGVAVTGAAMYWVSRNAGEISLKDSFVVVTAVWVSAAVAGCLPYYFTGTVPQITDAIFESAAGFTTTGATVLTDFAGLSHGILLWRSMTQWFGGMGIIVLALVVLPALGIGGMQLYQREVPGPSSDKLTPRIRDTAKALWLAYLVMTAAEFAALFALGMSPFDALNHSLTTVSTGGFGTRADSIAGFASPAMEWTLIFFMVMAGTSYTLHYRLFRRSNPRLEYFRDGEWMWYVAALTVGSGVMAAFLFLRQGYDLSDALTKGAFQVVAIGTGTGYTSDDYVRWGAFPQMLLLFFMFTGGCAGSTTGGVKWVRIRLVCKNIRLELMKLVHPHVVVQAKMNKTVVTREIQGTIYAFLFLFLITLAVLTLLISLDGHPLITSIGAAASALANIGPALEGLGPSDSYAPLSVYVKWVLICGMLLGRLEIMTVLVMFFPATWRR